MSHIPTPNTIDNAPVDSHALLQSVQASLGSVPNMFRLISNSSAALGAYLQMNNALSDGLLDAATRERIALAVAEQNQCQYCLSAHSYLATHIAKLSETEILANRHGSSGDAKAEVAVGFAVALVQKRGSVSPENVQAVLEAGYSSAEVLEIIAHVAVNTFTNYVNQALATEVDFPAVSPLTA